MFDVDFWLELNLLSIGIFWQSLWFFVGFLGGLLIWYPIIKVVVAGR